MSHADPSDEVSIFVPKADATNRVDAFPRSLGIRHVDQAMGECLMFEMNRSGVRTTYTTNEHVVRDGIREIIIYDQVRIQGTSLADRISIASEQLSFLFLAFETELAQQKKDI